ncbi:TspO/MBR family protein [Lacisediminihabitans sp. H27-G8]|uniref:TspO/MBR family protein n=1 Tax=Lacisediminihabitans sp. H27-G8 TaxID=3111909 RepID=UPI0038FC674E
MNETRDTVRQAVVLVSAIVAVVGAFIGSGAAGGTPIQDAAGGALAADATPIAPGGPAFAIWTPIYAGLLAYAVWQSLPKQRADERQRRLGYPIAVSLILNAAWILSIQFGFLAASVPIIAGLLVVLVWAFRITLASRPKNLVETIVADGTVGLYLGWVCVATAANITALLVASGFRGFGLGADAWAVVIVAVAGLVGVLVAIRGNGRLAPAVSLSWGLAWVAVARLTGDLLSAPAGIAAIVAVVVVVFVTVALRIRNSRSAGSPKVVSA